jgi:hypothetical protein
MSLRERACPLGLPFTSGRLIIGSSLPPGRPPDGSAPGEAWITGSSQVNPDDDDYEIRTT